MKKNKDKIKMIDCSLCKESIVSNNKLYCTLKIKDNELTIYSQVTKVTNCNFIRYINKHDLSLN